MKHLIEFDLPKDQDQMRFAVNGAKYHKVLFDIRIEITRSANMTMDEAEARVCNSIVNLINNKLLEAEMYL